MAGREEGGPEGANNLNLVIVRYCENNFPNKFTRPVITLVNQPASQPETQRAGEADL